MSRSARLLDLVQVLRRHRRPVSGKVLAGETGISIRTLYRDIATLQAQGADIRGEPGVGYVLRPGFMLPPLMFSDEEIEALVLGSRWVTKQPDDRLALAATNALAKIASVLPPDLHGEFDATGLLVGPRVAAGAESRDLALIRGAIRGERKLTMSYSDAAGARSSRTVWPFALAFLDKVRLLAAWCEARQDYRHFRIDRISDLDVSAQRYPRRRAALLRDWRARLDSEHLVLP